MLHSVLKCSMNGSRYFGIVLMYNGCSACKNESAK